MFRKFPLSHFNTSLRVENQRLVAENSGDIDDSQDEDDSGDIDNSTDDSKGPTPGDHQCDRGGVQDQRKKEGSSVLGDIYSETEVKQLDLLDDNLNKGSCHDGERINHDTFLQKRKDNEDLDIERFNLQRKVFVGNINKLISLRKLKSFFGKFGKVEYVYMVKDHFTKRFKGIAFVTFSSRHEAVKAISAPETELELDGRILRISEAEISKRVTIVERGYEISHRCPSDTIRATEKWEENESNSQVSVTSDCRANQQVPLTSDNRAYQQEHIIHSVNTHQQVSLTNDALCHVFTFLSLRDRVRVERVCTQWREAAKLSWSQISSLHFNNVFKRFQGLTDVMLGSLLHRCGQYLTSLDLSASPRLLTDISVEVIGETCPRLENLDLSGVAVTDISLKGLSEKCTTLKVINLQKACHVKDKGVAWILKNCHDLQSLNLQDNQTLTGECFRGTSSSIHTLILNDCIKLKDSGIYNISQSCPLLKHLEIGKCLALTEKCLHSISSLHLEHLKMYGIPRVTCSSGLVNLLTDNIRTLVLSDAAISDIVLRAIGEKCQQLRYLDISCQHAISDVGVSHLRSCPHLTHLNISYNHKIGGDEGIKALARRGILQQFIARACSDITDESICELATYCSNLQLVDVSGVFDITNRSVKEFLNEISLKENVQQKIVLNFGGTSVDLDTIQETINTDKIELCLQDWSQRNLRVDREIILPEEHSDGEEDNDDDLDDQSPPSLTDIVGLAAGAEYDDDYGWNEYDEDYDEEDDFLFGDDPLERERWEFS